MAETFDDSLTSVSLKLNILRYQDLFIDAHQTDSRIGHPVLRIIEQYRKHSNILAINNQNMDRQYSFQKITKLETNK